MIGRKRGATLSEDEQRSARRLPPALLGLFVLGCVVSGAAPPGGHATWALEVAPMVALAATLAALYRRLPLSDLTYVGLLLHSVIVMYGAHHTYAEAPLGEWAQEAFDLERNHYDRLGHVALGLFPALLAREVLLRRTPLVRGGWLAFLVISVTFAVGAFWELLEWWTALLVAPELGEAFLASQGDVWDAQWDMFLVLVGAVAALVLLSALQDRSMRRLDERAPESGVTST